METQQNEKIKQPPGLYLLAITASWERFSFYGMRAFLIFYMLSKADSQMGGVGWSEGFAGKIYGLFNALCYFFPLFGGYLADRFFGERRSVLVGGILIMIGYFICAFDNGLISFITGLTFIVIGSGLFKPTIMTMVGDLYEQGDKRRDSAFTIYYMIFNIAVCIAPLLCGFLNKEYGYKYGFIAAGVGMIFGLTIYAIKAQTYLGNIGKVTKYKKQKEIQKEKQPLSKVELNRISVILVLLFFATFFWVGYEQAGSTFNIFTEKYINRVVLGWEIPAEWSQAINPIFVVILSPIFAGLWMTLQRKGKNPSTPIKIGISFLFLGIGFLFMVGAVIQRGGDNQNVLIKASLLWIIVTYLFHTIAELCISPIGLSMVTKLAPLRLASVFMGVWFLSNFLAHLISGFLVGYVNTIGASEFFGIIAIIMVVLGIVVFTLSRWLLKRMHGRD
jgi:proton-dependent oligopeptide transporter, POT family